MGSQPIPTDPRRHRQFMDEYLAEQHRRTISQLADYGLSDLQLYRTENWYIGDDSEGTIRKYYKGNYRGETCFVKLAQNDSTIRNEIFVNHYVTSCDLPFVPRTLTSDKAFDTNTSLLVTQFFADLRNFEIPTDEHLFERYCGEFIEIHKCFRQFQIVHCDISATNLLINDKKQLVLIDFGIGKVPGSEIYEIDYRAHDGHYYVTKGNSRIYDDAYSFLRMLDKAGLPDAYREMGSYRHIQQLVGTHQNKVLLSDR